MAILPARPVTLPSAAETAGPGTATSTTSASLASPPSRPSSVTSCPALRHSAARPPPTFPRPMVTIFIGSPISALPACTSKYIAITCCVKQLSRWLGRPQIPPAALLHHRPAAPAFRSPAGLVAAAAWLCLARSRWRSSGTLQGHPARERPVGGQGAAVIEVVVSSNYVGRAMTPPAAYPLAPLTPDEELA